MAPKKQRTIQNHRRKSTKGKKQPEQARQKLLKIRVDRARAATPRADSTQSSVLTAQSLRLESPQPGISGKRSRVPSATLGSSRKVTHRGDSSDSSSDSQETCRCAIVDFDEINQLLQHVRCPHCGVQNVEVRCDKDRAEGLAALMTLRCQGCGAVISERYTSKKLNTSEAKLADRLALAGIEPSEFLQFCKYMGILPM